MSCQRVLLVGSGLTSASVASKLAPYSGRGLELVVWDRARGPGGRLVTQYSDKNSECRVDPGAQYITNTKAFTAIHQDFYKDLVHAGLLLPVTEGHKVELGEDLESVSEVIDVDRRDIAGILEKRLNSINSDRDKAIPPSEDTFSSSNATRVSVSLDDKCWSVVTQTDFSKLAILTKPINYVAPQGVNNMIKHLWAKTGIPIQMNHNVSEINLEGDRWLVKKVGCSSEDEFSSIILTMPIPQLLNIGGNFRQVLNNNTKIYNNLRSVKFNSVFTLALFYDRPMYGFSQIAKYFPTHPVVRFVAVDNLKRRRNDAPTSIIIQTHREFAASNFGLTKEEMEPILYKHVMELMPELPTPASVKCHRWRYSQVETPYPGSQASLVLHNDPLLMAAGDSFTNSNVDGCLTSADHAANTFLDRSGLQEICSSVNAGT